MLGLILVGLFMSLVLAIPTQVSATSAALNLLVWTFPGHSPSPSDFWDDRDDTARFFSDNYERHSSELPAKIVPYVWERYGWGLSSSLFDQNGCFQGGPADLPYDTAYHVNVYGFDCVSGSEAWAWISSDGKRYITMHNSSETNQYTTPPWKLVHDNHLLAHELTHALNFRFQHGIGGSSVQGVFNSDYFAGSSGNGNGNFMTTNDYYRAYDAIGYSYTPVYYHGYPSEGYRSCPNQEQITISFKNISDHTLTYSTMGVARSKSSGIPYYKPALSTMTIAPGQTRLASWASSSYDLDLLEVVIRNEDVTPLDVFTGWDDTYCN